MNIDSDDGELVATPPEHHFSPLETLRLLLPLVTGGVAIYYLLCPWATKFITSNIELKPGSRLSDINDYMHNHACQVAKTKLKISENTCSTTFKPHLQNLTEAIQKCLKNYFSNNENEVKQIIWFLGFGLFGMGVLAKTVSDKIIESTVSFFRPRDLQGLPDSPRTTNTYIRQPS